MFNVENTLDKLNDITKYSYFYKKYNDVTTNPCILDMCQYTISKNLILYNNVINKINNIEIIVGGNMINKIYLMDDIYDNLVYGNIINICMDLEIYKIVCKKFIIINEELTSFIYSFLSGFDNLICEQIALNNSQNIHKIPTINNYKIINLYDMLININMMCCMKHHDATIKIYYDTTYDNDYYSIEHILQNSIIEHVQSLWSLKHDIFSYSQCCFGVGVVHPISKIFILSTKDILEFSMDNIKFIKYNKNIFYYVNKDKIGFSNIIYNKLDDLKKNNVIKHYVILKNAEMRFMSGMAGMVEKW